MAEAPSTFVIDRERMTYFCTVSNKDTGTILLTLTETQFCIIYIYSHKIEVSKLFGSMATQLMDRPEFILNV